MSDAEGTRGRSRRRDLRDGKRVANSRRAREAGVQHLLCQLSFGYPRTRRSSRRCAGSRPTSCRASTARRRHEVRAPITLGLAARSLAVLALAACSRPPMTNVDAGRDTPPPSTGPGDCRAGASTRTRTGDGWRSPPALPGRGRRVRRAVHEGAGWLGRRSLTLDHRVGRESTRGLPGLPWLLS